MPSKSKPESALRARALRSLSRREHSRHELTRKLSDKGADQTKVEMLLDQLESEGLLSDRRFAESYVYSRRQRGFGPLRIALELRERGVDDALIRSNLDEPSVEWLNPAKRQYHKRFGRKNAHDIRDRARRVRYMQGRGFSSQTIMAVFEELE